MSRCDAMTPPLHNTLQCGTRWHLLSLAIALSLPGQASAQADARADEPLEFSDGFLIGGHAIDLARYAHGNPVAPGVHGVDVHINGTFDGARDVLFQAVDDQHGAVACVPASLLPALSLKPALHDALLATAHDCLDLPGHIDGATVRFDSSTLQLHVGIPQAAQAHAARGYVPVAERDDGISAAFIDYSANHYRSEGRANSYLGLNTGLNLGPWRLRHRASLSDGPQGRQYQVISSHLQRDIPAWNSQLWIGQGNTGGELFESVAFTGARVASDERMLPDSLRGYAPVVQGIAEGNAVVRIRQNGNVIHEATVAPGPFSIEDLYPTSFGGDLEVTVTEADGREQRFTVNFSAVPQALRAGASRFSANAGELRDAQGRLRALRFAEGTYAHGLSNHLTLLGGAQIGQGYAAALAGAAVNTPVGAFGADVTHSRARLQDGRQVTGNSYRLNYQRYVARTGTHFGLAAYRYSTRGYLSLGDAARAQQDDWGYSSRTRQRYQLNLSQRVGERSTLYLSGGHVSYWDSARRRNDFQLGFQSVAGRVNYGISALRYRLGNDRQDTRYSFTLSVPLGRSANAPRLSSQLSHAGTGQQGQLGLNGTLGEARTVNYSLSASEASQGGGAHSAYVGYQGSHLNANIGASRSSGRRSVSAGASGSVVLHGGGLNFGQPLGEGFVLVQAPGAQGARVGNGTDIRVGRNGYALLPHVSPYRWNRIDLDPSGLPLEVELLQTSQRVAPTAGGIVRVPFEVRRERTLFIEATDALGQPLPFAARVEGEDGRPLGAVGQGGVIALRGAHDAGALIVDPDGARRCRLEYRMPDAPDGYGLSWSQALCMPLAAPVRGLQAAAAATP